MVNLCLFYTSFDPPHPFPEGSVADILLKHPRIFEYIAEEGQPYLVKGKARIQVSDLRCEHGS